MAKQVDKFANKFYGKVVESAANTLTFGEIQTQIDVFTKRAWILHKLEWYMGAAERAKVIAADDVISAALVSSNQITALGLDNAGVIDMFEISTQLISSVGFEQFISPIARDFTQMPGGGLIISPRPLYLAVKGTSLASAVTVHARGYFTSLELTADDYLELVDFYRIVQ